MCLFVPFLTKIKLYTQNILVKYTFLPYFGPFGRIVSIGCYYSVKHHLIYGMLLQSCHGCSSMGWLRCHSCQGRGYKRCISCNGSGRDWKIDAHGHRHVESCWQCHWYWQEKVRIQCFLFCNGHFSYSNCMQFNSFDEGIKCGHVEKNYLSKVSYHWTLPNPFRIFCINFIKFITHLFLHTFWLITHHWRIQGAPPPEQPDSFVFTY